VPTVREECESWLASYHESDRPPVAEAMAELLPLAMSVSVEAGHTVTRQFAPADRMYVLLEGALRFQVQVDQRHEGLDVGTSTAPGAPVGWSGFHAPGRYDTTTTCVSACRLLGFDYGRRPLGLRSIPMWALCFWGRC